MTLHRYLSGFARRRESWPQGGWTAQSARRIRRRRRPVGWRGVANCGVLSDQRRAGRTARFGQRWCGRTVRHPTCGVANCGPCGHTGGSRTRRSTVDRGGALTLHRSLSGFGRRSESWPQGGWTARTARRIRRWRRPVGWRGGADCGVLSDQRRAGRTARFGQRGCGRRISGGGKSWFRLPWWSRTGRNLTWTGWAWHGCRLRDTSLKRLRLARGR